MPFIVYKITNLANGNCYIGVTKKTSEQRFKEHVYAALKRNTDRKLYHAIRKYGAHGFTHETMCSVLDEEHVLDMEAHFIKEQDSFTNGYNMNEGGYGLRYHTEETKAKMSRNNCWRGKDRSGELNPMFGRGHTEESKQKQSEKVRERISREGHKGNYKPHSEDAKKKISMANRGKRSAAKTYMISYPDGRTEATDNLKVFCDEHELSLWVMQSIARGQTKKSHNGFTCKEVSPK